MAIGLHSAISFKPPLYGIAISPKRFTYQLIVDSGEFGINFLPFEAAELIASAGGSSGQQLDKFQHFNIAKEKPVKTRVPLLEAAYAAYECQLVYDWDCGDHRWVVGEVVAMHLTKEAFTPEGALDLNQVNPALFMPSDFYVTTDKDKSKYLDRKAHGHH